MASRPRILVIDDDPNFRRLIAGLLKSTYNVTVAASGEDGYQLALTHPPHVVLIDVNMPDWDGLKTLRKFREHAQLSATKAAMLTGDATRHTVMSAIQHGADEYIVKTRFRKTELLSKLQHLIAKSSLPLEDDDAVPAEAVALVITNEHDPRLQEIIDDWE